MKCSCTPTRTFNIQIRTFMCTHLLRALTHIDTPDIIDNVCVYISGNKVALRDGTRVSHVCKSTKKIEINKYKRYYYTDCERTITEYGIVCLYKFCAREFASSQELVVLLLFACDG